MSKFVDLFHSISGTSNHGCLLMPSGVHLNLDVRGPCWWYSHGETGSKTLRPRCKPFTHSMIPTRAAKWIGNMRLAANLENHGYGDISISMDMNIRFWTAGWTWSSETRCIPRTLTASWVANEISRTREDSWFFVDKARVSKRYLSLQGASSTAG